MMIRRRLSLSPVLFVMLLNIAQATTQEPAGAGQLMAQGRTAWQQGDFEAAVVHWSAAVQRYRTEGNPRAQVQAQVSLAEAYQALGQLRKALQALNLANNTVATTDDLALQATVAGSLGKTYLLTGEYSRAREVLEQSVTTARQAGNTALEAKGLNNLGTLLLRQDQAAQAGDTYQRSAALAQRAGDKHLHSQVLTNAARAAVRREDYGVAKGLLERAFTHTRVLSDSHDKAYGLITLGQLFSTLPDKSANSQAVTALNQGLEIAERLGDVRAQSYALGYLGELYAPQRRADALTLMRRAAFSAQQARAPELLYRWQWQSGRLLNARGDTGAAIAVYRQAVDNLQTVRQQFSVGYGHDAVSFRKEIEPVYFELADLLLTHASNETDATQAQAHLYEARQTVERLKAAELENYFQDECVAALQSRTSELDQLPGDTAAVYPILLPDRIELLLILAQGIKQVTVPGVGREVLTQEVRALRRLLEKRTTREYLPHAQQLYEWLIQPLAAQLAANKIRTLVFVPDGPLRTIPMAALHDGKAFLIERYAVAVTPGLTLTDFRPAPKRDVRVLVNGITESVQGYPALAHVSLELDSVGALYGGTVLENKDFLVSNVKQQLTEVPYAIVHIASHGEFSPNVDESFVLAYDGKLTMDRLERFMGVSQFRDQPVELLTLSACQSAAGDDRAALGLAGISVKAGARSALATLWFINDEASSVLVSEFYQQLRKAKVSKAKALQEAQLNLLSDRRYRHPGYWAPFLLIGNWL